ncbi:FAD:protein FMN transferase [Shewanella sp. GXUN23E]|uniref:FAD:protein FMN transferase n=1 Tax=Shewanella sp. GXUN23E TaxID=3422498 RepID=UPI003D7C7687
MRKSLLLAVNLAVSCALSLPVMADTFEPKQCQENATLIIQQDEASLTTLKYFGTSVTIQIWGVKPSLARQVLCDALNVVQEYHYQASNFSTYPGYVNIHSINLAPEQTHHIDPKLTELLATSLQWHELSGGRFNIALSPVVDVWRQYRKRCQQGGRCELPPMEQLEQAAEFTRVSDIKLDTEANTISMRKGMSLDLGGIAKGWMVEKVYDSLKANGVGQFIINAGGNIRHYGKHPSGRAFITGIEDPVCRKLEYATAECQQVENQYHELVAGEDLTLVSSGNYLNYYEVDGKEYHHIIDPLTLMPKPEGISVTVVMQDSHIIADVLSTSLFLMSPDQANALLAQFPNAQAVWYDDAQGNKRESVDFNRFRLTL